MMNTGRFSSSSFFSEEACFSSEKPIGAKMMDHINCYSGLNSDGILRTEALDSPSLENRVTLGLPVTNGFGFRSNDMNHGRNANVLLGRHIVGAERAGSMSLPNAAGHYIGAKGSLNKDSKFHLFDGDKVTFVGAQHENGLFSSSLSDLFNQNLKLSLENAASTQSNAAAAAVGSHCEEDEAFESLAELEAKTIGNLLPDDDDLLSGVTDNVVRTNNREEAEGLDLFSSSGGLELGEDACLQRNSEFSQVNSSNHLAMSMGRNGGNHLREEYPSRMLFVRNINSSIEDSELLMLFEQYGDICSLHTACKHQGLVVVSYYDIRAACNAMKALRNKLSVYGRLDIHFSKENLSDKDINQGILVVLNNDSSVSNDALREIFSAYGEIKEIREAPHISSCHKCIEFYDIRAVEAAFCALNRSDVNGQQIKLELGQPGGSNRLCQPFLTKLEQERASRNLGTSFLGSPSYGDTTFRVNNEVALSPLSTNGDPLSPIMDNGLSSAVANSIQSLVRAESTSQSSMAESGHLWNHGKYELHGAPNFHPHSLPDYHDGLAGGHSFIGSPNNIAANISPRLPKVVNGQQLHRVNSNGQSSEMNEVFGSPANGSCPSPGHHYMWSNSHQPRPQAAMWPNSPSFVNGIGAAHPQHLHAVPQAPSHMLNAMPLNNHHVRSAPSVNPSLWERRHRFVRESPEAAGFHPGSLGNLGISGNSPHPMEFMPHNIYSCAAGSCMDLSVPSKNIAMHPNHQRCLVFPARGQMHPMMSLLESPNERTRNRRNDGSSNQADNKKQFELDLDRIIRGEDKRTTLMIKNIPNKYTSKMLLAAIDERHKGTYDFLYLPIDFKNKCNVGYAFINMTDPSLIVPFYHTFNGKKWEKFNSEKVASLAYARIQGKAALVAHFQNSSLMNEDKRCRPILFHTDGPNAGDQVPFPMGTSIRTRLGKTRANTSEENIQEVPPQASLSWEDHPVNEELSAGSGKDSD